MTTKKRTEAKPAAKPFTPAEAMAEATRRARVWATPVKKAALAKQADDAKEE